jgi:hypothetical protein
MPAKFHVVRAGMWDKTFRRLSKEAKIVAINVYTSRLRSNEGLFELSVGHIAADTNLSTDEIREALEELSVAGLVDYDTDNEVVLDRLALKTNPLRNPRDEEGEPVVDSRTGKPKVDKRIPNAVKLFCQVPESPLKLEFIGLAFKHSPDLADAITVDEAPYKDLRRTFQAPSKDRVEKEQEQESLRDEQESLRDEQEQEVELSSAMHLKAVNEEAGW